MTEKERTMDKDWLQELKPGDEVAVDHGRRRIIEEVERVTATQIVVGGTRFNRQTGDAIGVKGRWSSSARLKPATDKERAEIEHLDLARRLGWMEVGDWHSVPVEKLRAVVTILDGGTSDDAR
jgi:hypothetical protein